MPIQGWHGRRRDHISTHRKLHWWLLPLTQEKLSQLRRRKTIPYGQGYCRELESIVPVKSRKTCMKFSIVSIIITSLLTRYQKYQRGHSCKRGTQLVVIHFSEVHKTAWFGSVHQLPEIQNGTRKTGNWKFPKNSRHDYSSTIALNEISADTLTLFGGRHIGFPTSALVVGPTVLKLIPKECWIWKLWI